MARPSNTAQRRKQILSAFLEVMATQGYHGASIAKIAKQAGLASGLILYHFESKNEILIEAVAALVGAFEARYAEEREKACSDARSQIAAFVDAHLALGQGANKDDVAAWVIIGAQAVQNDEVRQVYSESLQSRLRELERLVRADYKSRCESARGIPKVCAAILSAIEGSYLLSCAAPGVLPAGYAAPSVNLMIDGLLA